MTGETNSTTLPMGGLLINFYNGSHPYDPYDGSVFQGGGRDAFVAKVNTSGMLGESAYLGGYGDDIGYGIAVGNDGGMYVTGYTGSPDFPIVTVIDYQSFSGGAFVIGLSGISYSTSVSGFEGHGITVDSNGNAYVTGCTSYGSTSNAFVTKIDASGSSIYYKELGGSSEDCGNGIAVDSEGNAYVTGFTGSSNFPTANSIDGSFNGSSDAFVSKINASGTSLLYSTYLGGSSSDYGTGIAIDSDNNVYVTGETTSSNFPTENAIYGSKTGLYRDAFVTKIAASGASLSYSTYLGGSDDDVGYGIAVDGDGNAYVTGYTISSNFPMVNAINESYGSFAAGFVAKISIIQGSASTETGTNVVVQPVDSNTEETLATIAFNEVTYNGETTVSVYNSTEVAPPPSGFWESADQQTYYEVDTTATFQGAATVCFPYPNGLSPEAEQGLKLFHYEDTNSPPDGVPDAWVDITTSVDTVNNIICGITTSFSPFAIFEKMTATAVTLLSFTAKAGDDGVTLIWETASETNNAGFNIYRSRLRDGEYKKINDTLIPAKGDATAGASYRHEDMPPARGTYYYKLEDVDTNGVSTMHGPEKVRVKR